MNEAPPVRGRLVFSLRMRNCWRPQWSFLSAVLTSERGLQREEGVGGVMSPSLALDHVLWVTVSTSPPPGPSLATPASSWCLSQASAAPVLLPLKASITRSVAWAPQGCRL